jgi:NAD(P)-dependent dehydrogenase (short-subunit alcohol dehydrogenase family)
VYKPFDLTGKVSLITGGASGIGFGMAEALAQASSDIVLWDVNPEYNAAAVDRLSSYGVRVLASRVDVSDETQVVAGVAEALATMGRIDTGIACAGIFIGRTPFADQSLDAWRKVHAVNAEGVFLTLREIVRHMLKRGQTGDGGGSLIGFSSIANFKGSTQSQAYGATKGAVPALMRALAAELGPCGIRANAIAPGWIATDQSAHLRGTTFFDEKIIPRIPVRRWGMAADLGGIAVYLASEASAFHTGDLFVIDGGYIIS